MPINTHKSPAKQKQFQNSLPCRKKVVFLRQNITVIMTQSIENIILNSIRKRGRGTIFFSSDFSKVGEKSAVLKALERMTAGGTIIRVARGIYCYPKIDKELGLGTLYPTYEEIAQAIAKRDKARIVPAGIYAMNRLGLSTQVPMNVVYLTDGSSRKVVINGNRGIQFNHVAPKNLAFQNQLALLINSALKEIGQDNITEEEKTRIKSLLSNESKDSVMQDVKLMPDWIASIIREAYE